MNIKFEEISRKIDSNDYQFIGSGSGRSVFDLGNGYVVKAAKNKRGLAQNMTEYSIASHDQSNLFARIPKVSEDYQYLIMEKAEKIKDISEVWAFFNVKSNKELFGKETLKDLPGKYGLLIPDLIRAANWGKINGRPVIIDYGFTRRVRNKYYLPF